VLKWSADPYRDTDVMTDRAAAPPANGPASRPVAATALAWSSVLNRCVYIPSVVVTLLCP
jgi:hypothetical protein